MSDNKNPPENPPKNPQKNPWGPRVVGGNDGKDKETSDKSQHNEDPRKNSEPETIWTKNRGNPADDIIDRLQERLKKMMDGGNGGSGNGGDGSWKSSRGKGGPPHHGLGMLILIAIAVIGIWLATGFFRVQEGEIGVIMRFGEMVRTVGPGLQYHFPSPFEDAIVKKISAVNRTDGGMTVEAKSGDTEQALTLTSDENMVIISYSMQWRIKDISEFLFTAKEPEALIRVAAESVIREIVGQTVARLALMEGREGISNRSQELLQKILDSYKIGVEIISFQLQRVEAPPQVIESFNDVQASLVDAGRLQNEAESYRNQIVPVARGNAVQIVQNAQAYAQKLIAEAEGEANRFNFVYTAYAGNKKVALTRYYMDTMQRVLKASPKIILDPKIAKDIVPYLPLNDLKKHITTVDATKTEKK